jgi:hypothetical protein
VLEQHEAELISTLIRGEYTLTFRGIVRFEAAKVVF